MTRSFAITIHGSRWAIRMALWVFPNLASALGPQHVLVLVRSDSPISLHVANHYRTHRHIPPENFVFLEYSGPEHRATQKDFFDGIHKPALEHIKKHGMEKRIHVWVTTPGLPYRIENLSLSGVVHFGQILLPKSSPTLGPAGFESRNQFAGLMLAIDAFHGIDKIERRPLHMHLWAGDLPSTLAMIERSARADHSFPKANRYLCDGIGPRSSRSGSIPHALRMLDRLGVAVEHVPGGEFKGKRDIVGLYTGCIHFPVDANEFVAGALADHLTSTGGVIDTPSGQMSCLEFLKRGSSATYGTVVEPYNYPQKFPSALTHVAYAAGFSAVESYWMSVVWPHQGLFAGDPLTRPFGRGPELQVQAPLDHQRVSKELPIEVQASAVRSASGVGMFDVWIDGVLVANFGLRRLPSKSAISISIGSKKYESFLQESGTLSELLEGLRKKLSDDGYHVTTGPASLFVHRNPVGTMPALSVSASPAVLHAEIVGGGFHPARHLGSANPASSPHIEVEHLNKDFAWIRFGTGPKRVHQKLMLPLEQFSDGLHTVRIACYHGDETLTPTVLTRQIIKETQPKRFKLMGLATSVSIKAGSIRLARAVWDEPSHGSIEFRIDERPLLAPNTPNHELEIDPRFLGIGKHVIRARVQRSAANPFYQESDNQIEIDITP